MSESSASDTHFTKHRIQSASPSPPAPGSSDTMPASPPPTLHPERQTERERQSDSQIDRQQFVTELYSQNSELQQTCSKFYVLLLCSTSKVFSHVPQRANSDFIPIDHLSRWCHSPSSLPDQWWSESLIWLDMWCSGLRWSQFQVDVSSGFCLVRLILFGSLWNMIGHSILCSTVCSTSVSLSLVLCSSDQHEDTTLFSRSLPWNQSERR